MPSPEAAHNNATREALCHPCESGGGAADTVGSASVAALLGLLIGTVHLLVMLNAGVRSIAGKWVLGGVVAAVRVVVLMALSMAGARIRMGGVEPTPAITFALYGGPALTVATFGLAFYRRRKALAGAGTQDAAEVIMRAWRIAAIFDLLFVIVNVTRILGAAR